MIFAVFGAASASVAHASFESECESAHGHAMQTSSGLVCLCGGLKRPIHLTNPGDVEECEAKSYTPIVDQLSNLNHPSSCSSCPQDGYVNNPNNSCGETLLGEFIAEDKQGSLTKRFIPTLVQATEFIATMGASTSKPDINSNSTGAEAMNIMDAASDSKVMATDPNQEKISPDQLESYLATQSRYRFGAGPGTVESCFLSSSDDDKKAAISKYYYLNNRLRAADLSSMQMISTINSVLSKPLLDGLTPDKCKDFQMQDRSNACDFYANQLKCKPAGGLDQMVGATKDALLMRDQLQKKLDTIHLDLRTQGSMGHSADTTEENREAATLTDQISLIESMHPWMLGKAFKSAMNYYSGDSRYQDGAVRDMVQKQLLQNRASLISQLDRYRQATSCLNNEDESVLDHCKDFNETIADTPAIPSPARDKGLSQNARAANYYIDKAAFSWDYNNKKKLSEQAYENVVVIAGLLIPAIGAEEISGATTAFMARAGTTVGQASRWGKIGSQVLNFGYAANGARQDYIECSKDLNEIARTASTHSVDSLSCPLNPFLSKKTNGTLENIPNIMANYQACLMHTIAASTKLIPLLTYGEFIHPHFKAAGGAKVNGYASAITQSLQIPLPAIGINRSVPKQDVPLDQDLMKEHH
jgi:hypothetical protein